MSSNIENVIFDTVEMLSLYTTMAMKRIVVTCTSIMEQFTNLIQVVENNLEHLKVDKKWFLATLRDHARLHRNDWSYIEGGTDLGCIRYNSLLLVLSLKIGLDKVWPTDNNFILHEELVHELLQELCPVLPIKELDQKDPLFTYFTNHCVNLKRLNMSFCTDDLFEDASRFRYLSEIEFGGRVSDKVICSTLWNMTMNSEDLLDTIVKEEKKSWKVNLPHLEILRHNASPGAGIRMALTVGAVAMAVQPKMEVVEATQEWDTYKAVLHLLDLEAKHKNGLILGHKFNVTCLSISCQDPNIGDMKRVLAACPKLSSLDLVDTINIHENISILCSVLPIKQVTTLNLEGYSLTDLELTVLLTMMRNLTDLTLRMTFNDLARHTLPIAVVSNKCPEEEAKKMSMIPVVRSLTLVFQPNILTDEEYNLEQIENFMMAFQWIQEFHIKNALVVPSTFLINGCLKGALAVMKKLSHLSIITCLEEDLPCELTYLVFHQYFTENKLSPKDLDERCAHIALLLMQLQDDATFESLKKLRTFVIDEFYLHKYLDYFVESLRLAGVLVSILYRPFVSKPIKGK